MTAKTFLRQVGHSSDTFSENMKSMSEHPVVLEDHNPMMILNQEDVLARILRGRDDLELTDVSVGLHDLEELHEGLGDGSQNNLQTALVSEG